MLPRYHFICRIKRPLTLISTDSPLQNKVPDNGRIPVKLTVLTEFSPQLTEDGHPNVLLSRTLRSSLKKL